MTDTTQAPEDEAPRLTYRVPATVAEMKPPKQSSLITEAANFLRSHWDEVRPYYECISGEKPTMHGSVTYDEAACVFKVQEIASQNGFAFLGSIKAAQLRRALRYAYKRNSGVSMRLLEKQNRQLRIAHQQ